MDIKNLISPQGAVTDSTIAVLWDKYNDALKYHIYVDDEENGDTENTDYTVAGLESGREYKIEVKADLKDGTEVKSDAISVKTREKSQIFNVVDFGAVGDGKTMNTAAIQSAVDACCDGGTVYIPEGTFLSGALHLKSNIIFCVDGKLFGSGDTADYPIDKYRFEGLETDCYLSLVNAKECENIVISGNGKIDANGALLRQKEITELKGKPGRAVCIRNSENIYFKDITVMQSPAWCVHTIYCKNVSLNNIKIYTKFDENGNRYKDICNGDGFDPDSSKNIYVFNSMIASQDDCIAIKSGRDKEGREVGIPCENVRVTNCTFKSGFGVVVGSEMSGSVRNVLVQDCSFENVYSTASIKAPRGRGGVVSNVKYENLKLKNYSKEHHDCEWFRGAINIDQFYSHKEFDALNKEEFNDGTPVFKDIVFKDIELETVAGNAVFLSGLSESLLENIYMENITAKGKYGMKANNIKGLVMKNVKVESMNDAPYVFNNVSFEIE